MALLLNTKTKLFLLCKTSLEAPLQVNATHDCFDDM